MRGTFKALTAIFLLQIAVNNSRAQNTRLSHFTTEDGLPENTGQALIEDREGFIWIGTQNGLSRFDGYEFRHYKHRENDPATISNNQVESLLCARDGKIWAGTRNGISAFDPITEQASSFLPDSSDFFNTNWFSPHLAEDDHGQIWASTSMGLYAFSDHEFSRVKFYPFGNEESGPASAVAVSPFTNQVWVGFKNGIYTISKGELERIATIDYQVFHLLPLEEALLVCTARGLFEFDPVKKTAQPIYDEWLNGIFCLKAYQDRSGLIWVLTTAGAFCFDEFGLVNTLTHRPGDTESLSHNLVLSMVHDRRGLFWFGTGQGLNLADPLQDRFLRINQKSEVPIPLTDQHVEVLHFANDTVLWIGTASGITRVVFAEIGNLSTLPPGKWPIKSVSRFTAESHREFVDDNVDYILPLGEKAFVGSSMGHLYEINQHEELRQISLPKDFGQLRGMVLREDVNKIWCGGSKGIFVLDLMTLEVEIPDWLPPVNTVQMATYQDEIWAGSRDSIYVISPMENAYRTYHPNTSRGSLRSNMLTHGWETDTAFWFTTFGGGLQTYYPRTDSFASITSEDGLINDNVWSVYGDKKGQLWMSTDGGVACFDPENATFRHFTKKDGLNFSDFSMTAHAQSPTGELWFGNPEGISAFHPDNLTQVKREIGMVITGLDVNYLSVPERLKEIRSGKRLDLQPDEDAVSFTFSPLIFSHPEREQWQCRLAGYEDEWIQKTATDRRVTWTNLPAGDFKLEYQVAGMMGSFPIRVIPPFYETFWFKTTSVFLVLLIFGLAIYLINRQKYRKRIRELETQKKIHRERSRISRDLHDHVGAHLTRIVTDLDILSSKVDGRESIERLEQTRGFTGETIQLLRDTIWAIHKDNYSLSEFGDKVESFLNTYLGDFLEWELKRSITHDFNLSPLQVLNLIRIVQEATQNMLKYSQAEKYSILIANDSNSTRLVIEDDGRGMDFGKMRSGYGFENMRKRAEDVKGSLVVTTEPDKGLKIEVEIPNEK